jgi:hypothetical protein
VIAIPYSQNTLSDEDYVLFLCCKKLPVKDAIIGNYVINAAAI